MDEAYRPEMKEAQRPEMEVNLQIEEDASKNGGFSMKIEEGHRIEMSKEFLFN